MFDATYKVFLSLFNNKVQILVSFSITFEVIIDHERKNMEQLACTGMQETIHMYKESN